MFVLKGKNIVGNELVLGAKARAYSYNPTNNEKLEPAYAGISDKSFEQACHLAWEAFLEYREVDRQTRAKFLDTIADKIDDLGDVLIDRAMQETALDRARLEGEKNRTCGQLRLFADVIRDGAYQDIRTDEYMPNRVPLPRPDIRYRKIPLGPVAIFGASNFPLAFSVGGGDTASALAAGCPVIVKGHSAHLGTSELVGQAIMAAVKACGMPNGVFSLVFGQGYDIGQKLVAHQNIKAVGFTGSRAGGMSLVNTANARPEPIPVYAEMSSINPVYLTQNALLQKNKVIAEKLVDSMTMGAGQFCTSPGLIFAVKGQPLDDFCKNAAEYLGKKTAQTMLTEGIYRAFCDSRNKLESISGVTQVAKGCNSESENACIPILFKASSKLFVDNSVFCEEVFGSCATVIECESGEDLLFLTEKLEGQLTASIHAGEEDDNELLTRLIRILERKAGRILFNGFGTGVEVCSAMVHGGPFPATSNSQTTSVGSTAIDRFLRPVCYQSFPKDLLPQDLF